MLISFLKYSIKDSLIKLTRSMTNVRKYTKIFINLYTEKFLLNKSILETFKQN